MSAIGSSFWMKSDTGQPKGMLVRIVSMLIELAQSCED
jgi:hypothetical protein